MEGLTNSTDSAFSLKNSGELIKSFPLESDSIRGEERKESWTGFETADWKKALDQRKSESNLYYKDKRVSSFVELNYFKSYGVGIYLFFSFVWEVSILFFFLSLISISTITLNYLKGNSFENSDTSLKYLIARSSIGSYSYVESSSTSYQESINYKIVNVSIDIFTCVVFFVFYFYWERKSSKITEELGQEIKMLSSNTLEVTKFPETSNEKIIENFMSRFGEINEVATVKSYSNLIEISKEIYEAKIELQEMEIEKENESSSKIEDKIMKQKAKIMDLEIKLESSDVEKEEIIKFYVQFEDHHKRNEVLKNFKPFQKSINCCSDPRPQEMLLEGREVWVEECLSEPTGIIWENVHITWGTRWMRSLLQLLIIFIVIAVGFIFICFLNILVPQTVSNIDTSAYTYTDIQGQSETIIEAWCIKNLSFSSMDYESTCYEYWVKYIKTILITVAISIAIVVFKTIVKLVMIKIAHFQRYNTHTEQSVAIMTNLFLTYLSTTVIITFLMQANVFSISFKSVISYFIKDVSLLENLGKLTEYYDLSSSWYVDIGYQIWFNLFLLGFIPHFYMPIVMYLVECISEYRAKKEKVFQKMYEKIKPSEFEIEDNYANILLIVSIGFIFGGGSPSMISISFIGLIFRYIYFKFIFIRFSRVPKTFNEALNHRVLTIFKIVLLTRCLISLYMYGASGVFAMEESQFMTWAENLDVPFLASIFVVVSRIFLTWYYSIFVILFILILVFKNFLIDTCISLCKKENEITDCANDSSLAMDALNQRETVSQRALTKSYKMEKNPDYFEILAIMKMRNKKTAAKLRKKETIPIVPISPE